VFGAIIGPGQTVATVGTFAVITLMDTNLGGSCPLTLSYVVIGDIESQSLPVSIINDTFNIAGNRPPLLASIGNKAVPGRTAISGLSTRNQEMNYSTGEIFATLIETKVLIEEWKKEYNQVRPRSAMCYRPPAPEAKMFIILTL